MRFLIILVLLAGCNVFERTRDPDPRDMNASDASDIRDKDIVDVRREPPDATTDATRDQSTSRDMPQSDLGTIPALDWTQDFLAVLDFEAPNAGQNRVTDQPSFVTVPTVTVSTNAVEGTQSITVDEEGGLRVANGSPSYNTVPGRSWTLGGWFNMDQFQQADIWGKSGGAGFIVITRPGGNYRCLAAESGNWHGPSYPNGVILGEWQHVTCRLDNNTDQLTLFYGGFQQINETLDNADIDNGFRPFYFSTTEPNYKYTGAADELFVVDRALSDAQIGRIFACGIDGSLCSCDPSQPTNYLSCGRANDQACVNLLPCNASLD